MLQKKHKIMGIDPGIINCGVSFIEIIDNNIMDIKNVIIKNDKNYSINTKLKKISNILDSIIYFEKPDCIVYEKIFITKNLISVIDVSNVVGLIHNIAERYNIEINHFTPNQIKNNLMGKNKVDKNEIISMINFFFNLNDENITDHEADAIAIAFTHIRESNLLNKEHNYG